MSNNKNINHDKNDMAPELEHQTAVFNAMYEQLKNSKHKQSNIPDEMKKVLIEHMSKIANLNESSDNTTSPAEPKSPDHSPLTSKEKEEIHSTEVQEILGHIPNWIVRWGISVIVAIIFIFLIGSWFIKYPDVTSADINITSTHPPVLLSAPSDGRIGKFLVSDQEEVTQGQYLVIFESEADYYLVRQLKTRLNELRISLANPGNNIAENTTINPNLSLGEIQTEYDAYLDAMTAYRDFHELKPFETKLSFTRAQLLDTRQYRELLFDRISALEQQYTNRSSNIDHEIVPVLESSLNMARIEINQTDIQIVRLEQSLVDLQNDSLWTARRLISNLRQACDNLMNSITSWERQNVLIAPEEGIVSTMGLWLEGQSVSAGDKIISVLPKESSKILGHLTLSSKDSENIYAGYPVNVRFRKGSTFNRGIVQGFVESISQVSDEKGHIVTVKFPEELDADIKTQIRFSQNIKGRAEIIAADRRLLERVFSSTQSFFN